MTLGLLRLTVLIAGWWAALWYALPVNLQQQSIPALVSWHLVPPLLVIAAWSLFKQVQAWRINRRTQAEASACENERLAALEAARVAGQRELDRRREHVDCRAVWAAVPELPKWHQPAEQSRCLFLKERADRVRGAGREAALTEAVRRIFVSALLGKGAALAWLPVYVVPERKPDDSSTQLNLLQSAWRDTVDSLRITPAPSPSDCRFLPGTGSIIERVIALFAADPWLPALFLVGMDSPLADAEGAADDETTSAARRPDRPGHAVAALLLSRPGLALPEGFEAAIAQENKDVGPYTPYWEREQEKIAVQGIGRLPLPLQPDLIDIKPFAALTRFRSLEPPHDRKIPAQLEALLIDAGLNDPPAGDDAGESPEERDELEFGWLVHNSGSTDGDSDDAGGDRLAAIARAIRKAGSTLDVRKEASNLGIEHGEVGSARSVLMLAEGLIRVEQLKKPVLIAEYSDGGGRLEMGLSRPFEA